MVIRVHNEAQVLPYTPLAGLHIVPGAEVANGAAAEQDGVFGVPSYVVDGELFWGAERLERAMEKVRNRNSA